MRLDRRLFLGSAAVLPALASTRAQGAAPAEADKQAQAPPTAAQRAMEQEPAGYSEEERGRYFVERPGSDFMVDVIKRLGIDYLAINAGSSFRGLQESVVSYGGNKAPEILTCQHEEIAVGIAHGYAKAAGRPIAVACHGTVGLQHAAMAVYNAWCDRVPMILIAGNHHDVAHRNNYVTWVHSAQDPAAILRDFTKWDDQPASLVHFAESMARAHKVACTAPMGPTVVTVDAHLQEASMGDAAPELPGISPLTQPQGEDGAVRAAAKLLADASMPAIVADFMARDQRGVDALVALAEALQAPVIDKGGRMNFPSRHHLNQSFNAREVLGEADVILALEVQDIWGTLFASPDLPQPMQSSIISSEAKIITIGMNDAYLKANYQDFQRYFASQLAITADSQTTIGPLAEAVRVELGRRRKSSEIERRAQHWRAAAEETRKGTAADSRRAWDANPVTTARMSAELWEVLQHRDWVLASQSYSQSYWPQRLWSFDRHHQYLGSSGGAGLGYGGPAAVGIALANRPHGRFVVNIQGDGDFMMAPGAQWTAAHHRIPLLTIIHNNGGYHQELMHLQKMAGRRQRGGDGNARIGNMFDGPTIDYAQVAKGFGIWAEGPVSEPQTFRAALRRAVEVVERGEPALIDLVSQPR